LPLYCSGPSRLTRNNRFAIILVLELGNFMDISIIGLTSDQVDMLDFMWNLDTEQEFTDWFECLDDHDQRQASVLRDLVMLENMEAHMAPFKEPARNYLKKFRL